jgi:hypothetical protein
MNELTLNIYNLVTEKIPESVDWLTLTLTIIGIIIAYYALVYNRARIEIVPTFSSYDFKEEINIIKLCFYNVGSSTAFNIRLEHNYNEKDFFHHPEDQDQKLYDDVKAIVEKINNIGEKALLRPTNINNHIIYNSNELKKIDELNDEIKKLEPDSPHIEPLSGTSIGIGQKKGIFYEIRKNDDRIKEIRKKHISVKSCLDIKLNTLISGEKKANYLTDYSYRDTHIGQFKLEDFTVNIIYNEIKKMDIISIFLFSIIGLIIGFFKSVIYLMIKIPIIIIIQIVKLLTIPMNFILKNKKISIIHVKSLKNKIIKSNIVTYLKNKLKTNFKYKQAIKMFFYNLKMFFLIEFNLEKMEIIIKRKEVKIVRFDERLKEDDIKLQRQLNHEKNIEFKYKEYENFLNSFIFQNWLDTLNKVEKQKVKELLLDTSKGINQLIEGYEYYKNKIYSKKSLINKNENFLNKYINLIHIINNLPEKSPLVSLQMKESLENIIFNDNLQKRLISLKKK